MYCGGHWECQTSEGGRRVPPVPPVSPLVVFLAPDSPVLSACVIVNDFSAKKTKTKKKNTYTAFWQTGQIQCSCWAEVQNTWRALLQEEGTATRESKNITDLIRSARNYWVLLQFRRWRVSLFPTHWKAMIKKSSSPTVTLCSTKEDSIF